MQNSLSLLPLSPDELQAGLGDAVAAAVERGFSEEEYILKLGYDFDVWLDYGAPAGALPSDLQFLLGKATWSSPARQTRGSCYASLISKLTGRFAGTRRESAIILSQLPLILQLARNFRASPACVARLLGQTEKGISVDWRLVEAILGTFGIKSDLEERAVVSLIECDRRDSDLELGDSTVETVVEILMAQADNLGLDQNFKDGIQRLFLPDRGACFIPYLQILLYICTVDHFFDHPPEFIYTFKPRGGVANLIFGVFPSGLAPGGNPMLNNFKAVNRITLDWAESRPDNREQARALVEIVEGLSSLAYSPRVQISAMIRKAIVRYIEINTPAGVRILEQTDFEVIKRFVGQVADGQTGTRGVIEQRVIDFLGAFEHPLPDWRARGLGDPVNASNRSSRKLGDCDFQNVTARKCIALEAHAGRLTDVYVKEHLRTLRLNLPSRLEEWSRISEVSEWSLLLRFVAHEDARSVETIPTLDTVASRVQVVTYRDYYHSILPAMEQDPAAAIELFNQWVMKPLDANNTPLPTKEKVMSMLAAWVP